MANPVIVAVPKDVWTKVATSVQRGQISIIGNQPSQFLSTYRTAGDLPPVSKDEGIAFSRKSVEIRSKTFIDVYIRPEVKDGTIRVDV